MSDLDLLRGLGDRVVPPPIDALRETAHRRRRQDAAVAGGVVAAVVALAAGVLSLVLPDGDDGALPPSGQPPVVDTTRPLAYALGPAIHYGDQTVVAAAPVVELDVTDDGILARTDDGTIWFTDGDRLDQVGTLGEPGPAFRSEDRPYATTWGFMVSGNTGSRAAWLEFPEPGQPEVVVYDTASREVTSRQPLDVDPGSYVLLDQVTDDHAYWYTSPEMNGDDRSFPEARVDLATGVTDEVTEKVYDAELHVDTPRSMMISHAQGNEPVVYQVHDGIAWQFDIGGGRVEPQGAQPLDARDGGTGQKFEFDAPPDYPNVAPNWLSQWLDDDTVVITVTHQGNDDLLECHFTSRACTVAAEVPEQAVMPDIG